MNKEFWDFDENINYITVSIKDKKYNVIYKFSNYNEAAKILYYLDSIIKKICNYLRINLYRYSEKDQIAIECFLAIHDNHKNYRLSEMQLNTIFNGLNKPRNIHKTNNPSLGKDTNYRAKNRHVFLTLRKNNGDFKALSSIINLLIHEIAHTMCNHIRWRDDDHNTDFKHYEKILKDVYKKIE